MRLFIPTIGTRLKLISDWQARIKNESRNDNIYKSLGWPNVPQMIDSPLPNVVTQRYGRTETTWQVRREVDTTVPQNDTTAATNPRIVVTGQKTNDWAYSPLSSSHGIAIEDQYRLDIMIPSDTILVVDRIYIRKGKEDFDSITFTIEDCPVKGLVSKKNRGFAGKGVRFWVELDNANEIDCEVL